MARERSVNPPEQPAMRTGRFLVEETIVLSVSVCLLSLLSMSFKAESDRMSPKVVVGLTWDYIFLNNSLRSPRTRMPADG